MAEGTNLKSNVLHSPRHLPWLQGKARSSGRQFATLASTTCLLDRQQLDVENQRGVGRNDPAGPARSIAELRRDDQRSLAADLHGGDPLVPAGDDALHADGELEGCAAVDGGIEFFAF